MKKTVMLLLIASSLNAFAETVNLNLDMAVQKAFEKDKNIKTAKLNLENAKLDKKQAFKSGLPSVNYSVQTTWDSTLSKAGLSLNQTIFDGMKTFIAIKNSGKYLEVNEYALENTQNSTRLAVMNSYVSILKLQKQLEVLGNSKKELESNYKRVQRLYELNLTTKTEALNLNYSMIDLDSSIIQAENALEIAKLNLKNMLGVSKEDEIALEEIKDLKVDIDSIDFENDLREAKERSLGAKIAETTTELKKALEGTERSTMLPKVDLSVLYGNTNYINGNLSKAFKEENFDTITYISVTGTMFDWGKNWDAYKQSKNNTKIAEEEKKETQDKIEIGVKTAYLELIRLEKLKEAKTKALESSSENYKYQKQRYENQLISSTEYLDAENNLRKSEIDLFGAELDLFYAYNSYLNILK